MDYFLAAEHMTAETEQVMMPETNVEHCVQIANTYYSCMYVTCTSVDSFNFYFLKRGVHGLFGVFCSVAWSQRCLLWYSVVFKLLQILKPQKNFLR